MGGYDHCRKDMRSVCCLRRSLSHIPARLFRPKQRRSSFQQRRKESVKVQKQSIYLIPYRLLCAFAPLREPTICLINSQKIRHATSCHNSTNDGVSKLTDLVLSFL